jgi:EAL domain-containing protein (putative c-di-GMP-specific phosphodiesterase class I)
MAKLLDIDVTAEGVETAEQLSTLQAQGCDYVQGYYCGFPLTAIAFSKCLSENAGTHAATPL